MTVRQFVLAVLAMAAIWAAPSVVEQTRQAAPPTPLSHSQAR